MCVFVCVYVCVWQDASASASREAELERQLDLERAKAAELREAIPSPAKAAKASAAVAVRRAPLRIAACAWTAAACSHRVQFFVC
jgi:hypothetical protein